MVLVQKLHNFRIEITSSLWFVPGVCVVVGLGLAIGLTAIDVEIGQDWIAKGSRLFGIGAEGARGMLAAIAGSMMTVASLSFSLTISTLATASSQYTSRLIRNFMRDGVNQFVLGYFVGLFGYCLVVLRSIRSGDEGAFVPSLAVMAGLVLALISIGVLIFFIHHIAESIQASVILDRVTEETLASIGKLFPADVATASMGEAVLPDTADDARTQWHMVTAGGLGYVQSVDPGELIKLADARDTVVRMEADIGTFVTCHAPLCSIAGTHAPDDDLIRALRGPFSIGPIRTIEQDAAFGIRQIVDIALKALSPGINDTTTGVMCVEHLGAITEALGRRDIPDRYRAEDGMVRLIARGQSFRMLVQLAFDQIRLSAGKNVAVLVALLRAVANTARQTDDVGRRAILREQAMLIAQVTDKTLPCDYDRDAVRIALSEACHVIDPLDPELPLRWLPSPTSILEHAL